MQPVESSSTDHEKYSWRKASDFVKFRCRNISYDKGALKAQYPKPPVEPPVDTLWNPCRTSMNPWEPQQNPYRTLEPDTSKASLDR